MDWPISWSSESSRTRSNSSMISSCFFLEFIEDRVGGHGMLAEIQAPHLLLRRDAKS